MYLRNNDPSACIMYFKVNDSSGVDMSGIDVNEVDLLVFIKLEWGVNLAVDVSGVRDIFH